MIPSQVSLLKKGEKSPNRKRGQNRTLLLRASCPRGMPTSKLHFLNAYVPEVCRRVKGSSPGDIIVVSGLHNLSGIGKTSVLASVIQQDEIKNIFSAMFWMNLGICSDDHELFGAFKILAYDVYATLRNLVECIAQSSECTALEVFDKAGKILVDMDTFESIESVLRDIISATGKFLCDAGYGDYSPLLVLDDLWNQRLLLLLRETGFVILVSTRHNELLPEGQFAGCNFVLEPLPTEACLQLFGTMSGRSMLSRPPDMLVDILSSANTILEVSVLAGMLRDWEGSEVSENLVITVKKRRKIMSSKDNMQWIDRFYEKKGNSIFSADIKEHGGLMTTLLLAIELLDEFALKCYLSLVGIPPGFVFDFQFLKCFWDISEDYIVKWVLNELVSRSLLLSVAEGSSLLSTESTSSVLSLTSRILGSTTSSNGDDAAGKVQIAPDAKTGISEAIEEKSEYKTANNGSNLNHNANKFTSAEIPIPERTATSPNPLKAIAPEASISFRSYQLHPLHADFLLLCALNFADVKAKSPIVSSLDSIRSMMGLDKVDSITTTWRGRTFSEESNCLLCIQQACDRGAAYFASKDLLLRTDPYRMFVYGGCWRRLERLHTLHIWHGVPKADRNHSFIIPFLKRRIETELQLEGRWETRPLVTRACMVLELLANKHDYTVLEEWYRDVLESLQTLEAETEDDLLEQARILDCIGKLLVKAGSPYEAVTYHRKALLLYPQLVNTISTSDDEVLRKRLAEKGMLAAMENVTQATILIPRSHPQYNPHAYNEAIETQRIVVKMKIKTYGRHQVTVATSVAKLAEMLCHQGMYQEALVEHESCLKLFAERLGTNHELYQAARGDYGITKFHIAGDNEDVRGAAVNIIQEALVWQLRHGVSWDDPKNVRLKAFLPIDNIEYLKDSVVGAQYIPVAEFNIATLIPVCGVNEILTQATKDCVPIEPIISSSALREMSECLPMYEDYYGRKAPQE